ncbi:DNA cytosine methyltransferase [Alicyclobacillus acidocaldarius]|uniref:Cytosine-specific methyltransferase n=1 Tax=Alicyclobacillus acidocaldarius (strain Tc-4-1) TaxID=1048834 RepID=F8IGY7_ALIAT|nr:DNA cytosine methyltransferase [Alicyclobacillus acidocaldarius]AEJ44341.1 DNA-cytosine methyltransferase [Alicyclobacillus acidocaldarius subsp. acidocaldarius Tc-4-1]
MTKLRIEDIRVDERIRQDYGDLRERSVELFAGAGGLAMGISNAGFRHVGLYEWDRDACDTIRLNKERNVAQVQNWPIHQCDVRDVDFTQYQGIDLLAGGPPCQPFSLGGKHRGFKDHRNMFPEMIRAVREIQPKVVLIENVKGLLRDTFAKYFEYILLQLSYPEIASKENEDWTDHLSRLERHHTKGHHEGLTYHVVFRLLNAADYGVPQKRERVFIVGFRSDLNIEWSFPEPTHSFDALLYDQWVTGDYWERHRVAKKHRPEMPDKLKKRIERLRGGLGLVQGAPWMTVRDAISDLPDPENEYDNVIPDHRFNPGARIYPGHTGSPLDEPAKTLKAGDHGVPGGENMLVKPDGSVRYFTVRESARLQTFPDEYHFSGSWTESMRQLGNAVPVRLATFIVKDIKKCLSH